jgi:hypothetical protein
VRLYDLGIAISFLKALTSLFTAKHLDQIKGGRFPVEVLVRGKDAAENEKLFLKITDAIKAAGVSHSTAAPRVT